MQRTSCEIYASYYTKKDAETAANALNLTVPDGVPKWIVSETIKNRRYAVVRFTE